MISDTVIWLTTYRGRYTYLCDLIIALGFICLMVVWYLIIGLYFYILLQLLNQFDFLDTFLFNDSYVWKLIYLIIGHSIAYIRIYDKYYKHETIEYRKKVYDVMYNAEYESLRIFAEYFKLRTKKFTDRY